MNDSEAAEELQRLTRELENFQDIAQQLVPLPGEVPTLEGFDIWGGSIQMSGSVGGDHITYVDFKKRFDLTARIDRARAEGRFDVVENLERCQHKGGVALIDVAGHRMTDALLAAMLHQAFLLGAIYELDRYGQITRRLFENLNTRFYQSSGTNKFVSLIYGEISDDAKFRFLSAGQPYPSVFSSRHDRFRSPLRTNLIGGLSEGQRGSLGKSADVKRLAGFVQDLDQFRGSNGVPDSEAGEALNF